MKSVYFAQKVNPCNGDWGLIIEKDMELVNLNMTESEISSMPKTQFKKHVKKCVAIAAFKILGLIQIEHWKIKQIVYKSF